MIVRKIAFALRYIVSLLLLCGALVPAGTALASAPDIIAAWANVPDGSYRNGEEIRITARFDQDTICTTSNTVIHGIIGGSAVDFRYVAVDNNTDWTFGYTIGLDAGGYPIPDGLLQNIAINGFCQDGSDNQYTNYGSLAAHFTGKIYVDNTAPTIVKAVGGGATKAFKAGQTVPVQIVFSEPVVVTGAVKAGMSTGGTADYSTGSGTDTLTFNYTVGPADNVDDLDLTSFQLNGGSIQDAAGNDANLSFPSMANLAAQDNIVLDTTPPQIAFDRTSSGASYAQYYDVTATATDRTGTTGVAEFYKWDTDSGNPASSAFADPADKADNGKPVPSPALTGQYYLHVKAVDAVGNETISTTGAFLFDNEAPTAQFVPNSSYKNGATTTRIQAADGQTGVKQIAYKWKDDAGDPTVVTNVNAVDVATPPSEGQHVLTATITDGAGNTGTYESGSFTVDKTAPVVSFSTEGDAVTPVQAAEVAVQLSGQAGETVQAYTMWTQSPLAPPAADSSWQQIYSGALPVDGAEAPLSQTFSTPAGADGVWFLHAKAVDNAGNTAIANMGTGFLLDNTAPDAAFGTDGSGGSYRTSASTQLIVDGKSTGLSEDGYTIRYLIDTNPAASGDGTGPGWQTSANGGAFTLSGLTGAYYIHVKASDRAGNATMLSSKAFLLDNEGPAGGIHLLRDVTNTASAEAEFTATDSAGAIEMAMSGDGGATWSAWQPLAATQSVPFAATDGVHTIAVKYRDGLLNESGPFTDTITYDVSPPTVSGITYSTLAWTNRPVDVTVQFADNYSPPGTATASYGQNGIYTVTFADEAGNVGHAQVTIANIDTVQPTIRLSQDGTESRRQSVGTSVYAEDNVSDSGHIYVSYAWSDNNIGVPDAWTEVANGGTIALAGVDGANYLWVKAADEAGNVRVIHSQPFLLDNTAPVGTVSYSTEGRTALPVTAYLSLDEPAVVTNPADGSTSHLFADNGDFTFEFVDEAGNRGSVTASVYGIDHSLPTAQVTLSTDGWTNAPVDVTISAAGSPPRALDITDTPADAVLVGEDTTTVSGAVYVKEAVYRLPSNGTVHFTIRDLDTGLVGDGQAVVNRIDTTPPTGELVYSRSSWTRDDVTVSLLAADDRSGVTVDGGNTHVFTDNGSYTFHFRDGAGNVAGRTATVNFIDREPPHPVLTYSTTTWTNRDVTATIGFDNEAGPVTILNNGGSKQITFKDNGSFTFNYMDAAGNTGSVTAEVDWIDREAPTGSLVYSSAGWTASSVTVTLSVYDNSGATPTIVNNGGSGVYTFTDNGQFDFVVQDAAGNRRTVTATVNRIDRTAPTAAVQYSLTTPTNGTVRATVIANEPVTMLNNDGGTTRDFADNGQFTFRFMDRAGNVGSVTATVANIDRTPPQLTVGYSALGATKDDVVATVTANEPIYVLNKPIYAQNNGGKYEFPYIFKQNGTVTFLVQDWAGNQASIDAAVTNIDKSLAKVTLAYSMTEPTQNDVVVTAQSDRPLTVLNNGGSMQMTFAANGVRWLEAKDAAGNEYTIRFEVTNIDRTAPDIGFLTGDNLLVAQGGTVDPKFDMTAVDGLDGDVTAKVTTRNTINPNVPGTYTATYTVQDRAGNVRVVTRKAVVVPTQELTVYVNTNAPQHDSIDINGSSIVIQQFGQQGDAVVKWAYGKQPLGAFKTNEQLLDGAPLTVDKQGYYTFLVQDQERRYKLVYVYVIPSR